MKKFTDHQRDKIADMIAKGKGAQEIISRYGVSRSSVFRLAEERGLTVNLTYVKDKELFLRVQRCYLHNMSLLETVKELHSQYPTTRQYFIKLKKGVRLKDDAAPTTTEIAPPTKAANKKLPPIVDSHNGVSDTFKTKPSSNGHKDKRTINIILVGDVNLSDLIDKL